MSQRFLFYIRSRMFSSPTRPGAYFLLLLLLLCAGRGYAAGVVLTVGANTNTATCGNSNGKMTVTVAGGPVGAVYSYTIQNTATFVTVGPQASPIFTNLSGGTYNVVVTDATGDFGSAIVAIGDILGPSSITLTPQAATCVNNNGGVNVTLVGGTPPFAFTANGVAAGTSTTITGLPSGAETIQVTDDNGCTITGTTTIPLNQDLTLTMGGGATICQGTTTTLKATSNGTSFSWSPATGLNDASVQNPVASPSATTTYTLTATLGICSEMGSAIITVLPAPFADAGFPVTTCYGKSVTLQGFGGVSYQWSPAAGLDNPTIPDPTVEKPTATATYSLMVTDANGCTSLKPSTVTVTVLPPYKVFAGDDTAVVIGQSVQLQAIDVDNNGFNSYVWSPETFLNNPDIADPVATPGVEGIYTYVVVATAPDGCQGVDTVVIKAFSLADIIVPTAFTPNNDGHNDLLHAICIGIKEFRNFTVFNRFGQQVFTTTNPGIGWYGSLNGTQLPIGTYVWMASGTDYTGRVVQRKGTVILVR